MHRHHTQNKMYEHNSMMGTTKFINNGFFFSGFMSLQILVWHWFQNNIQVLLFLSHYFITSHITTYIYSWGLTKQNNLMGCCRSFIYKCRKKQAKTADCLPMHNVRINAKVMCIAMSYRVMSTIKKKGGKTDHIDQQENGFLSS
jgi:hypothetical protein